MCGPACTCVHQCIMSTWRTEEVLAPLKLSYRHLCVATWVLGTKPRSCERAASVHNRWAPNKKLLFVKNNKKQTGLVNQEWRQEDYLCMVILSYLQNKSQASLGYTRLCFNLPPPKVKTEDAILYTALRPDVWFSWSHSVGLLSFGLDGVVLVDPELVKGKKGELSPLLILPAHPSDFHVGNHAYWEARVDFSASLQSSVPQYHSALEISGTCDVCGKPFVTNDSRRNWIRTDSSYAYDNVADSVPF